MTKRGKWKLLWLEFAVILAVFTRAYCGSQKAASSDKRYRLVSSSVEIPNGLNGFSLDQDAIPERDFSDDNLFRDLKGEYSELRDGVTPTGRPLAYLPGEEDLDSFLTDKSGLFAPGDVDGGLTAIRVFDAVATDSPYANATELAKTPADLDGMADYLKFEKFLSELHSLDAFEWPGEEDVSLAKSRVRRAIEPAHRYRRFQQPLRAYIDENSPVGTFVLEIPRNYDGKLEIVHPENPICRLNSKTGVMETIERLDYEKQKVYTLIVRDSENERQDALFYSHDVIIYVIDVNDNTPSFDMASYSGRVNSRSRVGSPVAQLNATDSDGGPRARIGFTINDRDSPFTVNPKTWALETNGRALDASRTRFPVNVKAFDQGYPIRESPTVVIDVVKANEAPKFSQTEYTFRFSERTLPGVVVGRVSAQSFSNIPVGYDIVPTSDVYAINLRGELSPKRLLDYDTARSSAVSAITVKASELTDDNPLSSRVSVTLAVTNDDDNPTTFTESVYDARIDEDVSSGSYVTAVTVRDCDCASDCRCTGAQVHFSLVDADGYFVINETGEIRTAKSFDFEIRNVFQFMVTAQINVHGNDSNTPARVYVAVKLRDVNNNPPKFTQAQYRFEVDEDSEVGNLVGVVQAMDKDAIGSPLTYRIKASVPKDGVFAITDQRFGIVTLASSLRLERQSTFTLTVEVSDGTQTSETTAEVHVVDVNDNAPQFTTCPESVSVEENISPGARVTVLKAVDSDRGRNALVEYSIEWSHNLGTANRDDVFVMNNETGEIKTALVLDREAKSQYFVIASARDRSHDSELRQVGYCQFVVNVADENDNFPYFEVKRYETSVSDDLPIASSVLKVQATDADEGENAKVTYTIDGGNKLFQVNSDGWVTVKSSLSDITERQSLKIVATNVRAYQGRESAGETSKTVVEISVTKEKLPAFTQLVFKAEVWENTSVGEPVLNVTAVPTSELVSLLYQMADLRRTFPFPFALDHVSGLIRLVSALDFERQRQYAFSVNALEVGRMELATEASVEITVVNANDVAPIFGRERYDATVSEDAPPGTVVIRMRAIDPDPPDVTITYEMRDSEDSSLFELRRQASSVEILTKKTFDREDREHYHVILVASDDGGSQLHSTAFVTVRVLDENDSPPEFDSAHYTVSVAENVPVGRTIQTVVSRDKDYGENARAVFFIAGGNDGRFRMISEHVSDGNRGYLVIAQRLDYEIKTEYNLTVVASDMKFSAVSTITVKVTNADDDPPFFERSLYNTSLPENTPPGTLVLLVEAIDEDSPADHLVYTLDSSADPYFLVGANTGAVTTGTTPLDREKTPVVVFAVSVSDGLNEAKTFVQVTLEDVNESPYFPNSPYVGYVEENQPRGTAVRYVTAFDDDDPNLHDGRNSNIKYSIDGNSGSSTIDDDGRMFSVDPTSGLLSTDAVFNLETIRRNLTIQIRASDGGSPSLYATVLVTIVVEDVSEFPPRFKTREFREEVSEDATLAHLVLKLTVEDADFTPVGHRYSITNGNYPFAFYVDPENGEIVVAGILDRESKKDYNLTVSVSESSISKNFDSDYASVLITVRDSNDQPPVFKPKTYYRKISEVVALGTEVRVVTCSDGDEGNNAVPVFSITGGNRDDLFEVRSHPDDKNLGVVRVSGNLDREKTFSYTLEITAEDVGGLKDTATLVVELEDVNDTPPKFNSTYYEGSVREGVREDQQIVTIHATHADQAPHAGPFTFTLMNFSNEFQLKNSDGQNVELYTKSIEFKRETTPLYQVLVQASDSGSPMQSATAMIFVNVEDGSATEESFDGTMATVVYALNGRFEGGTIGTVYYRDDDYQVDQNKYELASQGPGSYFTVDSNTGHIRCAANIPEGAYSLSVTVKMKNPGTNVGKNVTSDISVRVKAMNTTAVQRAVALRFPFRKPSQFVDASYTKLVEALSAIFGVSSESVYVFSIARSSGGVAGSPYGVDVWIAIRKTGDEFMNPSYVFTELEMNYDKLAALGSEKLEIGYDKCADESRSVGVCKNVLAPKTSFTVVSGYYGQVPAPASSVTVVGIDTELRDTYEVLPEPAPNCSSIPCMNRGTCHDVLPGGFVCECPPGFRGPECQATTRTFARPDSYIWLEPTAAYELSSISFDFMAELNIGNGLLLYQGALRQDVKNEIKDFLAVSLLGGFVTVALSLGGRPSSFDLRKGRRLDDGKWHHVQIKRFKKEIRLIIDHCESAKNTEEEGRFFEDRTSCEAVSQSFENFIYLNGLGSLQVGGSSLSSFSLPSIATQSFYGCIRNIYDNGRMYDMENPLKVFNAPAGCDQGCSSRQCRNNGFCESEGFSLSSCCTCPPGYSGCDCTKRSSSMWYLKDSFSEYNTTNSKRRQRRQLSPVHPQSSPKFHTDLVVRFRATANVSNALLFRSSTSVGESFSELGIKDKVLYYTFRFVDEMNTITLPGTSIANMTWHNVSVRRRGNTASLQLNYMAKSYGTTGGVIRLVDVSGGSLYTGGFPKFVSKNSKLGANGSLGLLSDNRTVARVDGDFQGCTSGMVYNGKEVDETFESHRFHVSNDCPCRSVIECENNGTCVDEDPPYCVCRDGFIGALCERVVIVTLPAPSPVEGLRSSSRNRLLDPVWICVFLLSLITLMILLCLLHTLPIVGSEPQLIEEYAHDSIMAYQEHGMEESDAAGYDIDVLMKHSRMSRNAVTSSTNTAAELDVDEEDGRQGRDSGGSSDSGDSEGRLEFRIMERVASADRDLGFFPKDEMRWLRDEGKYSDVDNLSEIEDESEEEEEEDGEDGMDVFAVDWDNFEK